VSWDRAFARHFRKRRLRFRALSNGLARDVCERRVGKPRKKANSLQALGKQYKDYATTEAAREAQL
jgi:hypothetical protein